MNESLRWHECDTSFFGKSLQYALPNSHTTLLCSRSSAADVGILVFLAGVVGCCAGIFLLFLLIPIGLYLFCMHRYMEIDAVQRTVKCRWGVTRNRSLYSSEYRLDSTISVRRVVEGHGKHRAIRWRVRFHYSELHIHSFSNESDALDLAQQLSKFAGVEYIVEEPEKTFWESLFG